MPTLARGAAARSSQRPLAARVVAVLLTWQRRARERDHLAGLTERELRDMGLTRASAMALARKPFWRA